MQRLAIGRDDLCCRAAEGRECGQQSLDCVAHLCLVRAALHPSSNYASPPCTCLRLQAVCSRQDELQQLRAEHGEQCRSLRTRCVQNTSASSHGAPPTTTGQHLRANLFVMRAMWGVFKDHIDLLRT